MTSQIEETDTHSSIRYVRIYPEHLTNRKDSNYIAADEVVVAIKLGLTVEIRNGIITGPLDLASLTIKGAITIERTVFKDSVTCANATFKHILDITNSSFKADVVFRAATFEKNVAVNGVLFCGDADFADITAMRFFYSRFSTEPTTYKKLARFSGAVFHKRIEFHKSIFDEMADFSNSRINGNAEFPGVQFKQGMSFNGVHITGHVFFRAEDKTVDVSCREKPAGEIATQSVSFEGDADFTAVEIGGYADFDGAYFGQKAVFDGAQIKQGARFRPSTAEGEKDRPVTFTGETTFTNAIFGSWASFEGATFKGKTLFSGAEVKSDIVFRPSATEDGKVRPVIFEDESDFSYMSIGQNADFQSAQFKKKVSFNSARIKGNAFFRPFTDKGKDGPPVTEDGKVRPVIFEDESDFSYMSIGQTADFQSAQFKKKVSFNSARIKGNAFFRPFTDKGKDGPPVTFCGEADFGGVVIGGTVYYSSTKFMARKEKPGAGPAVEAQVSFYNARIEGETFWDRVELHGGLDVRGCSYDSIQPEQAWKKLMEGVGRTPYDRQPYTFLENVFRKRGNDRLANEVYLTRRKRERQLKKGKRREILALIWDIMYWAVANYGVRPLRLGFYSLLLVVLGAWFFSLPSTVIAANDQSACGSTEPIRLTFLNAFAVSLNQFLPIDVPWGSQCIPSSKPIRVELSSDYLGELGACDVPPSLFATVALVIPGWLLVPVGVASLTGLLRRVAPR